MPDYPKDLWTFREWFHTEAAGRDPAGNWNCLAPLSVKSLQFQRGNLFPQGRFLVLLRDGKRISLFDSLPRVNLPRVALQG